MAQLPPPDSPRADLIEAAIQLFGLHGYEGASTRAIAGAAGKPMSAITYHFGGKHGLYLATAHHIAAQMNALFAAARALADAEPAPVTTDFERARAALRAMQATAISTLTRNEVAAYARFIIGEQAEQSEAFDILYKELFEPMLAHIAMLLRMASGGRLDEAGSRLRATMLIGQFFMFRLCRATVLRNMGWSDIGEEERAELLVAARKHLDAMLDAIQGEVVE